MTISEKIMREALQKIVDIKGSTGGAESLVNEFKFIAEEALVLSAMNSPYNLSQTGDFGGLVSSGDKYQD